MNIVTNKTSILFLVWLLSLTVTPYVYSGTINEITPLSFGTIVLKNNNQSYTMTVTFSGQVVVDSSILVIEPSHPAEYELTDFPANTSLNISFIVPSSETQLAGATDPSTSQFTISNHHTISPIINTDSLGSATINVGATLTTSGSGFYKDARYISYMTIMVDY